MTAVPVYWSAPAIWPGETVCIIGGGPSLTQQQVDATRGRCKVIAINDALQLAPFADLHYFCDRKWWEWHHEKDWYKAFTGLRVTLENQDWLPKHAPEVKSLHNEGVDGLSIERTCLRTGQNSGYQCINLAVHLGVKRILLLGMDMKAAEVKGVNKTHWHKGHPVPTSPSDYTMMRPHFARIVEPLRERGVEVINCTPGSALECFEKGTIESVLSDQAIAALPA